MMSLTLEKCGFELLVTLAGLLDDALKFRLVAEILQEGSRTK